MEFENVCEALEFLVEYLESESIKVKVYEGSEFVWERDATAQDVKDTVFEVVANIADLLGVSDIYLKE